MRQNEQAIEKELSILRRHATAQAVSDVDYTFQYDDFVIVYFDCEFVFDRNLSSRQRKAIDRAIKSLTDLLRTGDSAIDTMLISYIAGSLGLLFQAPPGALSLLLAKVAHLTFDFEFPDQKEIRISRIVPVLFVKLPRVAVDVLKLITVDCLSGQDIATTPEFWMDIGTHSSLDKDDDAGVSNEQASSNLLVHISAPMLAAMSSHQGLERDSLIDQTLTESLVAAAQALETRFPSDMWGAPTGWPRGTSTGLELFVKAQAGEYRVANPDAADEQVHMKLAAKWEAEFWEMTPQDEPEAASIDGADASWLVCFDQEQSSANRRCSQTSEPNGLGLPAAKRVKVEPTITAATLRITELHADVKAFAEIFGDGPKDFEVSVEQLVSGPSGELTLEDLPDVTVRGQDERRALEQHEFQQFLEFVKGGKARCVWSSYFECGPGPTRDYWFACSHDGNLANTPLKLSATRNTQGQLLGGFIVLHVHYHFDSKTRVSTGFNSAGKEMFAPQFTGTNTAMVTHVNARFAFEPEGGFSVVDRNLDWQQALRLQVGRGKMERSVLNAFDFDDPRRTICEGGWDWQASPNRYGFLFFCLCCLSS